MGPSGEGLALLAVVHPRLGRDLVAHLHVLQGLLSSGDAAHDGAGGRDKPRGDFTGNA
jgi:hypothetical protein